MELQKRKVAIIGAGVSGMVAALELSANCTVHLYEATDKIGGRATTIKDKKTGEIIDNGQHICIGAYHRFLGFLKEINSNDKFLVFNKYNIPYHYNGTYGVLKSKIFDGKFGLLEAILRDSNLTFIEKINTIIFALKVQMDAISFQNFSNCYELLKKNKQSDKVIKILWEPLIVSTTNTPIEKSSTLIFENIMFDGFLSNSKNASFYLPTVDFGELFSGFENAFLKEENKICYSFPVAKIERKENLFRIEDKYYDDIIVTTPTFVTKRLLSELSIEIEVPDYSPIVSIYIWTESKLIDSVMYSTINSTFDWIFNRDLLLQRKSNDFSYQLTKSNAVTLSKMKDEQIIGLIKSDLGKIFSKEISITHFKIIREQMATFLADKRNVSKRPKTKTRIKGLYLAGDYVANGYPSTLEGAAINGYSAARHILKHS